MKNAETSMREEAGRFTAGWAACWTAAAAALTAAGSAGRFHDTVRFWHADTEPQARSGSLGGVAVDSQSLAHLHLSPRTHGARRLQEAGRCVSTKVRASMQARRQCQCAFGKPRLNSFILLRFCSDQYSKHLQSDRTRVRTQSATCRLGGLQQPFERLPTSWKKVGSRRQLAEPVCGCSAGGPQQRQAAAAAGALLGRGLASERAASPALLPTQRAAVRP